MPSKKMRTDTMRNGQDVDKDLARLAAALTEMEDLQPPDYLLGEVMKHLCPKDRPLRRLVWRARTLVSLGRLSAAAVAGGLIVFLLLWSGPGEHTRRSGLGGGEGTEVSVLFRLPLPRASRVQIIGSFNGWNPRGYDMRWEATRQEWTLRVRLPRGRHEYAFLVDGRSVVTDPQAFLYREDGFGHRNALLIINGGKSHDGSV